MTLVQLFAHLTESLLYRANQVPERNRAKFLDLLSAKLQPAKAAEGLAEIVNAAGPLTAPPIPADLELAAGQVPFRTLSALDALPVKAQAYVKEPMADAEPGILSYYALLYAAYDRPAPEGLDLYRSTACDWALGPVDFAATTDGAMWIGLFAREGDLGSGDDPLGAVRRALGGRSLSLGLAPSAELAERRLEAGSVGMRGPAEDLLRFEMPQVEGPLGTTGDDQRPAPRYRTLAARSAFDPLTEAGVVELALPAAPLLDTWRELDPLEAGVGDLPPVIEDPDLAARLVTWIRIRAGGAASGRFRWAGINAVRIRQQSVVRQERLVPDGDGGTSQVRVLANAPVIEGSVALTSVEGEVRRTWSEIDDLVAAAPEVPIEGAVEINRPVDVFELDAEAGRVTFGDGLAGRRPAPAARLYASYSYSEGREGNVPARAIKAGPTLGAGYTASNPIPTTGGADPESVVDGERQVRRHLQHRDRLVTAGDFESLAWRAPGVEVGRVEVLPAWRPELSPAGPGAAPGAVTVMAIPRTDPAHPAAPRLDRAFLDALCRYLGPRRLVTTELIVRGPVWKGIWISVGIEVAGGHATAEVVEAVRMRLLSALSPLPAPGVGAAEL